MTIKAATVINKEKNTVNTTIVLDNIMNQIAEAFQIIEANWGKVFDAMVQELDPPLCRAIDFPEIFYQRIKDHLPKVESKDQQKTLKNIVRAAILGRFLLSINRFKEEESFFLISSKSKADFLYQIQSLQKELKCLLNIYKWPFSLIYDRYSKGGKILDYNESKACEDFLFLVKKEINYKPTFTSDIGSFFEDIKMWLFLLARKDFKIYKDCLANGYIYELIKSNTVLNSYLNSLYKMEIKEIKNCREQIRYVLIQVFLATYKKNTNLKDGEVKKFLQKLINTAPDEYDEMFRYLITLYGI